MTVLRELSEGQEIDSVDLSCCDPVINLPKNDQYVWVNSVLCQHYWKYLWQD